MIFSSVIFLFFFLPLLWTIYYLSMKRWRNLVLLLASLIFYIWGGRELVFVLLLSILLNYLVGLSFHFIDRATGGGRPGSDFAEVNEPPLNLLRLRKSLLVLGIVLNLILLTFYKYINFLVDNLNQSLAWLHVPSIAFDRVAAPLGISFFTFHALSYLIDTYRRQSSPQRNPLKLALYFAVFPKILAGPILKYRDAENQLGERSETSQALLLAIQRFILGLGKKVLIANPLAIVVDKIFAIPSSELGFDVAWVGTICFTLQIYFDFSGYTDMAIGLGKVFGFEFPENFNYPYLSQSVQEFWRRWHISLSVWFKDYLYIPLGGNRCSVTRQYCNLIMVFLLCGLWHGASWNFIVWGLWYGLFLVLERMKIGRFLRVAWRPLRHLYALGVIVIGWVLFRADNLSHAFQYLQAMSGLNGTVSGQYYLAQYVDHELLFTLAVGTVAAQPVATLFRRLTGSFAESPGKLSRSVAYGISLAHLALLALLFLLSCAAVAVGTYSPFIYFKF
jgi:alginate O-acetyltransferase complex protein AlgI